MWARKCASVSLSDDALAFQWPPLVFCSLSHFKTTSVTVPELGVGETAVAASPGGSIVARRVGTGWMTHWKCFLFFCFFLLDSYEKAAHFFFLFIYLFLILYVFPELFQHIRSVVRAPQHKHTPSHTWNEWERVRCWIKQTHLASVRKTPLIFKQPFSVN